MENHIRVKKVDLLQYDPLFITWTINDLSNEIILLVEIKTRERTLRDQPMIIWCILRITHLKLLEQSKKISWCHLQNMLLLKTFHVLITQIILGNIILNINISLIFK